MIRQARNSMGASYIMPEAVSSISYKDQVRFLADPDFIPGAQRLWSSNIENAIDDSGLYTAAADVFDTVTVYCQLRHNNVLYPPSSATLTHRDSSQDANGEVQSGKLRLPDFTEQLPTRANMLGNGAQQLAIAAEITITDKEELTNDEWQRFHLFDYYSHQAIPLLEYDTQWPVLQPINAEWALTTTRNPDFRIAKSATKTIKDGAITSETSRVFYLHSLAPSSSIKKFYAGLQDKHGWWHFFTEQKNIFEVKISPFTYPQLHIPFEPLHSFGFNNPSKPYKYEMNLDTYEYYSVTVVGGFKFCTIISEDKPPARGSRGSIVRFERDIDTETVCSLTGIVVDDEQTHTLIDSELIKLPPFASLPNLKFEAKLPDDAVIISIHRFSNISLAALSEAQRNQLFEDYGNHLLLEFYDKDGNRFTKFFGFIPKNQSRHRNTLIF